MPGSTKSLSRILSPEEQRAIAEQLYAQREEEDALRRAARCWPPDVRRALLGFVNRNRTARLHIWYVLAIAEDTLWPTSVKRSNRL